MPTFSMTGCVIRADAIDTSTLFQFTVTETTTNDEVDTISIAASGSFTPSFAQVATGTVLFIDASAPVDIQLNGNPAIQAKQLVLATTSITALVIENPSTTDPVTVRLVIGG